MITENFIAAPDEKDIFQWYFIVFNLPDAPYKGGYYLGKLEFPAEYPWKPPAIKMVSDTGRFATNARICLSISDYHPESWNPVWPVKSIIIGLISFFVTEDSTVGSINTTMKEREKIALASKEKMKKNEICKKLFSDYFENIGLADKKTEAVQPEAAISESNPLTSPLLDQNE